MSRPQPLPNIDPTVRRRLDLLGREFLADILTREIERHPSNVEALAELAHVLTSLGRLEEGLEADLRVTRLAPLNPVAHYNLACSQALLGSQEDALDALEAAYERGYRDADHMETDEDLASLRDHPRFLALLRRIRSSQAAQT